MRPGLVLLAALLAGCGPAGSPAAGTAEPGVLEVPFEFSRNRVIVPVSVGGSRPLRLILDTGMAFDGAQVYNPDLADSIELPDAIEVKVPGAGSGEPASGLMTENGSFGSGGWQVDSQRVIVLQDDAMAGLPSDGVVGYSLLGHHALELDFERSVMRLHEPGYAPADPGWVRVELDFRTNLIPWFEGVVNTRGDSAVAVVGYIDFASGDALELIVGPGTRFRLPGGLEQAYLGTGLSGDIHGQKGTVAWFELAGFRFEDVATSFAPEEARSKQGGAEAIIGCGLLSRFDIVFDYADTSRAALWLRPNSRFSDRF